MPVAERRQKPLLRRSRPPRSPPATSRLQGETVRPLDSPQYFSILRTSQNSVQSSSELGFSELEVEVSQQTACKHLQMQ